MSLIEIESLKAELQDWKSEANRWKAIARYDALTGLLNRRTLEEKLSEEWERAKRNQSSISILFLDVNDFKQINDTQGHEAGDLVLKAIADALQSLSLRSYDFVGRWAGDEFVVSLPDSSIHGANRLAGEIKSAIAKLNISVAIGVAACVPVPSSQYQSLIAAADSQMYRDKSSNWSA